MAISRALTAAVLLMGLASPAYAVTAPEPLSLAQAILWAQTNSLAARVSRAQLAGTTAQRDATLAGAFPTLTFQSSANYNQLPSGTPSFGNIVGFPTNGTTVDNTLSANQPLFDGFQTHDAIAIADLALSSGRSQVLQAEQNAMTNAATAYFQVLRNEALSQVAKDAVNQAQEHMRLADVRLKAGTGTKADTLQMAANLASAQGSLIQAQNAVNVARLTLGNVLNAPVGDRALEPTLSLPPLKISLSHDLEIALAKRPEIQQAQLQQQVDEAQVSLASRALLPTLAATARYTERGLNAGNFVGGVTLNWLLFDSFKTRNQMEGYRDNATADAARLETSRQAAMLDIRQQFQARQEASARIKTGQQGLAAAQEAYHLGLRRYEVGLSTSFELTDSQTTLTQSRNNYVQALYDFDTAEVNLVHALGLDLKAYLAP
jgi:outer membrane protein TolC